MPKNIYSLNLELEIISFVEQGHSPAGAVIKYTLHTLTL